AQAGSITPEMDKNIMAGLDAIYTMDFDAAERAARRVIELAPDHPQGYFAEASVAWTRYVYDTEETDQSLVEPFEKKTAEVIKLADRWLKKHPKDSDVLMIQGSAYGLSSRLLVMRRSWLSAYWDGRAALGLVRDAVAADPQNHDARLGVGMYDYYSDVYPRFIGVLAKIMLRGDRLRGIETLKLVAEKGRYSKFAAKLLLVEIFTMDAFGAKNPEEALRISREVRAAYPGSPMLHAAELVSLYEAKRYEEAAAGAREFLERVKQGKYRPLDQAKGSVILATALWAEGKKEEALAAMRAGTEVKMGGRLSRWSVWALTRAGQLEDLLGRHEDARRSFRAAAAEVDTWGMREVAKENVRHPFKTDGYPGPIQPP
ncbi:MAG: hypothetical protein FD126_3186, partial [Elusimicrobia bacterium]